MRWMTRALSMLALALVCCLTFVGPVAAASPGAPTRTKEPLGRTSVVTNEVLERAYQAELAHLARQDRVLIKAVAYLDKTESRITHLKGNNYDTSALEETLLSSRASVAEARTEWTSASDVLEEHAGFDDAGKVTNVTQAHSTVEIAAESMQQIHEIGTEALATIRASRDEFLQDNPGFTLPPGFGFPRQPAGPPAFELNLG